MTTHAHCSHPRTKAARAECRKAAAASESQDGLIKLGTLADGRIVFVHRMLGITYEISMPLHGAPTWYVSMDDVDVPETAHEMSALRRKLHS